MLLAGIRMDFSGPGISTQHFFLSRCNIEGLQQQVLLEKDYTINYNDFELTEAGLDFVWSRVAIGPDGRVYSAPEFNGYNIHVFGPDGSTELVFSREMEPLKRNERQGKLARQVIEAVGANYPVPPVRVGIEDFAPDVLGMWVADDGRLLVQTSQGMESPPEGTWIVLDVFSPEGKFELQVALPGDFDPQKDALFMVPGDRIVVVVGALDAFLSQQAIATDESDLEESEAQMLEIICFQMEP